MSDPRYVVHYCNSQDRVRTWCICPFVRSKRSQMTGAAACSTCTFAQFRWYSCFRRRERESQTTTRRRTTTKTTHLCYIRGFLRILTILRMTFVMPGHFPARKKKKKRGNPLMRCPYGPSSITSKSTPSQSRNINGLFLTFFFLPFEAKISSCCRSVCSPSC